MKQINSRHTETAASCHNPIHKTQSLAQKLNIQRNILRTPETVSRRSSKNLDGPEAHYSCISCTSLSNMDAPRAEATSDSLIRIERRLRATGSTASSREGSLSRRLFQRQDQSVYDTRGTSFKEVRAEYKTPANFRGRACESHRKSVPGDAVEEREDRHREKERPKLEKGRWSEEQREEERSRERERERDTSVLPLTNCIRLLRAAHGETDSTLFNDVDGDNGRRRRSIVHGTGRQ